MYYDFVVIYTIEKLLEMGGRVRHHFYDTFWISESLKKGWQGKSYMLTEQSEIQKNKTQSLCDLDIHFHHGNSESPRKQEICVHHNLGCNWMLHDKVVFTRKEENLSNISEMLWKHIRKGPDDVQGESSLSWTSLLQMWFKLRLGGCTETLAKTTWTVFEPALRQGPIRSLKLLL